MKLSLTEHPRRRDPMEFDPMPLLHYTPANHQAFATQVCGGGDAYADAYADADADADADGNMRF